MGSDLFAMIPGYVFLLPMVFAAVIALVALLLLIKLVVWCVRRVNNQGDGPERATSTARIRPAPSHRGRTPSRPPTVR